MRASLLRAILVGLVVVPGVTSRAEDAPRRFHLFARNHQNKEGTPSPAESRCIPNTAERAGCPRARADRLEPSVTPGGIGCYVGGGVLFWHGQGGGECRRRDEGTWGWDETGGVHCRRRVILGWSHGRRYQGGTGAYRTDGPVLPDLIYATTSTINGLGRREGGEKHE
jgi:hypothetical protein